MESTAGHGPENQTQASESGESPPANGSAGPVQDTDNKFQKAISAWRNIDLASLVPTLDTTASDLVAHQRDALVERKELAQKTKDFRKLEDSAKLTEIKSLLKAYQTYIDLITNHSKTVSSSFLQVYSSLSEAPDPFPLLEASVDSIVVADETVPKLEADNKHLQSTIASLTTQLESTEDRLQKETTARLELQDTQDSNIKEIEESWSAVLTEKQDNWSSREKSLEERTENQERLLKELKASYEVSQRLDRGEDANSGEGHNGATTAELEIVSSDLERVNQRLAHVEARNEQLRLELAQSTAQKETKSQPITVEEDPAYLRLRSENSSLLRKVDTARFEKESEKRDSENNLRSFKREVASLKEDRNALQGMIQKYHDYDEIKRELEVLKSIELATGEADEVDKEEDKSSEATASNTEAKSKDLEQMLLARNKKLNNELTVLRVSHQDLANRLETLQEDLSNTNMELEKSRNLTDTLEEDLSKAQDNASASHPAMSVAGTRYPASTAPRRGRASPTSSIISGFDTSHAPNTLESLRAGEPMGGGSGILPMITAQRDRFKKRNTDLESELSKLYQTVSSLRSEVASLQKDNLNLYEKTRYVSTYQRGQPASAASSSSLNPNPSTVHVSDGDSALDRYRPVYESKISPFAAFRGRESARAIKRLSLPERVVFQATRMILSTRGSRNLFGLYCLALHLLVFSMLYYATTAEMEQHSTRLADMGNGAVGAAVAGDTAGSYGANKEWQEDTFHE
ncbi:MAG: hypothetical protein M1831_000528 [Alyxoria varia]|nr:MAG: hypothetical protein M1831_000528 [Alyxoria varia]